MARRSGKSSETISIVNLKVYQDALLEMGASQKELQQASFIAGEVFANALRGVMTPFARTGKLRSTVKAKKLVRKVTITVGNNTTAKYAGLQNFGSRRKNVPAQRFIITTMRKTSRIVVGIYLKELQKLIDKYERKVN